MCSAQSSPRGATDQPLTAQHDSRLVAPVTVFLDIPLRVVFRVPDDGFQFDAYDTPPPQNSCLSTSGTLSSTVALRRGERPRTASGRIPAAQSAALNERQSEHYVKARPKTAGNACRRWLADTGISDRTAPLSLQNCKDVYDYDAIFKGNPIGDYCYKRFSRDSNAEERDDNDDEDDFTLSTAELCSIETMFSVSPSPPTNDVTNDSNHRTRKPSCRSCSSSVSTDQIVDADCVDDGVDPGMSSSGEDVFDFDDENNDDCSLEPSVGGSSAMDSVRMLADRLGLSVASKGSSFRTTTRSSFNLDARQTPTLMSEKLAGIIDDLAWLKSMDETLAGSLLSLCARLRQFKLQRHCLRHQDALCDVMDTHSERCHLVTHLLPYVDMTPVGVHYGAPLRHYRLTRADLNEVGERRFSVL